MINQHHNRSAAKCILLLLLALCISSSRAHPSLRNGSKVDLCTIDKNYRPFRLGRQPFQTASGQEKDEDQKLSSAKNTTPVHNLRGGILENSSSTANNSRSEAHQNLRGGGTDALRLSSYGSAPYVRSSSSGNCKKNNHLRSRSCAFCRSGQRCPYAIATKASDSTHSTHTDL